MAKNYKIIIWHVVVVILAWRLWALSGQVQFNAVTGLDLKITSLVWFLGVVTIIGLGYSLFNKRWWSASISTIVGLLFLVYLGFTWLNLTAVVIFWLCNVWSEERAISNTSERIKINIQGTLMSVLRPIVLGFFVMISFSAYQSTFAEQIKVANQLPSQSLVFIRNIVDKAFGSKLGPDNTRVRNVAVNEIAAGTFQSINLFLRPYFRWAPPVVAFGLFIILWGLSWLFVYTGSFVGLVIFWILKKTRVVRIEEKDVKAEILIV